ncbi:MAG TPA: hypothetical protein VM582_05530 [Candidatus Thermoplasmatota archaeon]|nr:hypothetical protein [Candidatus Thermoplasmatota archaeon]
MRSARPALVGGNLALALAIALTYGTALGRARWHDVGAYVALVAIGSLALPLLHRRPVTLLLASAGAWSALTGLFLVYVSPWIPGGRWMTWWHGATSVAFLLAFVAHWARNQPRLLTLARRLAQRRAAAALVLGAWLALGVATLASYGREARAAFTERTYDVAADVALWAAAALLGLALVLARTPRVRALLATRARDRMRGATDASLLLAMWLAAGSGFALLAGRALREAGAFWITVAWHVAWSALLLALVGAHAAFNARPLAAHAR